VLSGEIDEWNRRCVVCLYSRGHSPWAVLPRRRT
jgi:hypothetical protein